MGNWSVLIVDDNSPDGTGQAAEDLRARWPRVQVLHRQRKEGLGPAYRHGFQTVLDMGATTIIQMDADGSHPPALLPRLEAQLATHDFALASRYIPGGSMKIDPWRRLVSAIGNEYLRAMLGPSIHDWSTGYKAWRATTLRPLLARPAQSAGYAWLMEMNWLALQSGATVAEVPLVFLERMSGRSKFNWQIVWEDIRVAWRLRRRAGLAKRV